jgi:hypothetical protein
VRAWERGESGFAEVDHGLALARNREPATFLGWSPRGEVLAYGQADGQLRLIDAHRRAESNAEVLFDSNSAGPLAPGQKALYRIRFTSAPGSANTNWSIERHSLEIDPEPARAAPEQSAAPNAAPNPPSRAAPDSPPPTTQGTSQSGAPIVLERSTFILPLDGQEANEKNFPAKYCCNGYVVELHERDSKRVVGYVNLQYRGGPPDSKLATQLQVQFLLASDTGRPGDPLQADYAGSTLMFTVDDYIANGGRTLSGALGSLRATAKIEKARIEKIDGPSKQYPSLTPGAYFDAEALAVRVTVGEAPRASKMRK